MSIINVPMTARRSTRKALDIFQSTGKIPLSSRKSINIKNNGMMFGENKELNKNDPF